MNLDGNYCVDCDASIPPRAKRCAICALDANKRRASLRKEPSLSAFWKTGSACWP